jgi:hypothetical protein
MTVTKSPISLDPLRVSDGAPGGITRASVQSGCTLLDDSGEVLGQESSQLCTQVAQGERAKREGFASASKPRHAEVKLRNEPNYLLKNEEIFLLRRH